MVFNPFLVNIPILYPLKTPENQKWDKMKTLVRNELMLIKLEQFLQLFGFRLFIVCKTNRAIKLEFKLNWN